MIDHVTTNIQHTISHIIISYHGYLTEREPRHQLIGFSNGTLAL